MFDEYLESSRVDRPVSPAPAVLVPVNSAAESTLMNENPFAPVDNDPFINILAKPNSEASSSEDASSAESTYVTQTLYHLRKWSKDHPIDNVIGNPSRLAHWAWYDNLSWFLLDNKFFKGAVDPTLFTWKTGKHNLLVQIYVDDIIFASTDPKA
nr:retrovirus-related Pol polyprotein from transposon TNT 1-94 [Tanacetum cinerariifolium]